MKTVDRVGLALGAFAFSAALFAAPGPRSGPQAQSAAPSRSPSTVSRQSQPRSIAPSRPSQPRPSVARPSHGGRGHGGGYHRGGGRYYYPGYRYRPWGWGWGGWGGWGWGWGGYWGYSPAWYGGYGYGAPYAPYGYVTYAPGEWAVVDTDVSPDEAQVFLDGRFVGTADDFDGFPDYLYLKPGKYTLEFRLEGFETQSIDVDVRAGVKIDVGNKLKKIPGARQYGSYNPPQPEGGVRRFWGKEKDGPAAVDIDTDESGYRDWRDRDGNPEEAPSADAPEAPPAAPSRPDSDDRVPPRAAAPAPGPSTSARGRIVFRIEPDDAAVYVDDRFAGTAEELSSLSRGLQVPAGPHRVVVSRPGYGSESLQVQVEAGESETVELVLGQREGQNDVK